MSYSPYEYKAYSCVGDVYNKSSWTNLNDFNTNTMSATVSGNKIQIPDANVADFTKALRTNTYVCVNHWKAILTFKRTANPGGGGSGISLGIQSTNANYPVSNIVYFAGAGTLQHFYQVNESGYVTQGDPSAAITYSNNDVMRLILEREDQLLTATIENTTTKTSVVFTKLLNLTTDPVIHNVGQVSLWAQGGTFEVQQLQIINKERYRPTTLFVGDSKVLGFGASDYEHTITGILKKYYDGIVCAAGFSDKSSDILNNVPNLVAMRPMSVVMMYGSNDERFSVGENFLPNYATARNAFLSIGAKVIDVAPIAESGNLLDTQYANFKAAYENCVDGYNIGRMYGLYTGDGIHLNDEGYAAFANFLMDANVLIGRK